MTAIDEEFETYTEITVQLRTGVALARARAAAGLDATQYDRLHERCQYRMSKDLQLAMAFEVRARVGAAERRKPLHPLETPAAAQVVYDVRCPGCGAHKICRPRTAYIYCDYCGRLFDYDWGYVEGGVSWSELGELFGLLTHAIREPLRECRERRDWDGYRTLWSWAYGTDMEVLPRSWSPRIGDRTYREAMVAWSVETCVLRNTIRALQRARDQLRGAIWQLAEDRSDDAPSRRFEAHRRCFEAEIEVYEEHDLLNSHPDGLDASGYRRINLATQLRTLLPGVLGEARARLIENSGLAREVIVLPPRALQRSTCGRCDGPLLVADGAKRTLCEACGQVLQANQRNFPCPDCGAPVLVAGERSVQCAYCRAVFPVAYPGS